MSLCLSLLILITAHLALADGKYTHHLWLMHSFKTWWKKARRQNDKDQIGILSYLLPSAWIKCVVWFVKQTENKSCCRVCSHLIAQVIHLEQPYSVTMNSLSENVLKLLLLWTFHTTLLYASSSQDTNSGPYEFQEFQSWIETLQFVPVCIW